MNENQYVIFKLSDEFYAIKIDTVETIERDMEITRVPKTQSYIKGVINLRGEIVPVIDLRSRLGLAVKQANSETRIIVSKLNDMMVGYIVDATYEVKELLPSSIEYTSVETASASSYVRGIAKDNDRMIILLDVDKVLSV
jgi:chemotaxis signal transduction protein cheW